MNAPEGIREIRKIKKRKYNTHPQVVVISGLLSHDGGMAELGGEREMVELSERREMAELSVERRERWPS